MMWHEKKEAGEKTLFHKGVKCAIKRKPVPPPEGEQQDVLVWADMTSLEQENAIQIRVVGRRCPECDQQFENVSTLKRHYFRQHEKDLSKWPYQCALCKKAFATVGGEIYCIVHGVVI